MAGSSGDASQHVPAYHEWLESLRRQFPQPTADPAHDERLISSLRDALAQLTALKSGGPLLTGSSRATPPKLRLEENGQSAARVLGELVQLLGGMVQWAHPRSLANIDQQPLLSAIQATLLAAIANPNLCSEEGACGIAAAEVGVVEMVAELVGYDPRRAGGVFTFGGTGAMLYGIRIGLEKAMPGSLGGGVRLGVVVLTSERAHVAALNVAAWLGIGQDHVIRIPTNPDHSVNLAAMAEAARGCLAAGRSIAAIIATVGSTDAFGLDDLGRLHELRASLVKQFSLPYVPHLHADAVTAWAWAVFRDYDFTANTLGFRPDTCRALQTIDRRLRHLHLADSIGIDFHKTGYAPYISSLVLLANRDDLRLLERPRTTAPYLFQAGQYHPGLFTLETSRSGSGPLAALANLRLLGKHGFRVLLGHAVEMTQCFREHLSPHRDIAVANAENAGPVTLLRVYPPGIDAAQVFQREQSDERFATQVEATNALNRKIAAWLADKAARGGGALFSVTEGWGSSAAGTPIAVLKAYVLSPFSDEATMRAVASEVLRARDAVLAADG